MSAQKRLGQVEGQLGKPKDYVYTVNQTGLLTDEQRRQYEVDGFFIVKGLLPGADCDKYVEHFQKICDGKIKPPRTMTVMKDIMLKGTGAGGGEKAITKVQNFQDDDVLFSFCEHPEVMKYVEAIVGSDIRAMHTMLINKPTDLGMGTSRHPPHQDLWYFPFRPAEKIVAAWTALQEINAENGCLLVIPGSHKLELKLHEYPNDGTVNKAYHGIQGMSDEKSFEQMQPAMMQKGDTIFFHPLLIHGSYRNSSPNFRKAISCHYANSKECFWFEDPTQSTIADEIVELSKALMKRGNRDVSEVKLNFIDVWKFKSRQVKGDIGQLK